MLTKRWDRKKEGRESVRHDLLLSEQREEEKATSKGKETNHHPIYLTPFTHMQNKRRRKNKRGERRGKERLGSRFFHDL